jgi:photosystem II stability/assembly factor-like uncharacterized protein
MWKTPSAKPLYSIARGLDRFVIVGQDTCVVIVDGADPVVETTAYAHYAVTYHKGRFWRVTNSNGLVQSSVDGVSWDSVLISGIPTATISIASSPDVLIVGCATDPLGHYAISTDGGSSWTTGSGCLGAASGNFAIWLVGAQGTRVYGGSLGGIGRIAYSDPPYSTWLPLTVANARIRGMLPNPITDIAFSPTCGIAVGDSTAINRTTDGGVSWLSAPNSSDASKCRFRILFDGSRFVIGGNDGRIMAVSSDGLTITQPGALPTVPVQQPVYSVSCSYAPLPPTYEGGAHDLLVLPNGRAETTESLAQRVDIRLRTFIGEHWLNPELGVPWFEEFLRKAPDLAACRQILVAVLQDVPGVVSVDSLTVTLDKSPRQMRVSFVVSGTDSIPQSGTTAVIL